MSRGREGSGGRLAALLAGVLPPALFLGLLRPGLATHGFLRASVLVSLASSLALALVCALLLACLSGRRAPRAGTCFWFGLALAATPLAGAVLPEEPWGWAVFALGIVAAPRLARLAPPPRIRITLAVAGPGLLLALLLLPRASLGAAPPPPLLPSPGGVPPAGPDVLLVSVDTLRADDVLAMGEELPALAGLRRRGAWAPWGLSTSNQTAPAHASLLSGQPTLVHGVGHNHARLPGDLPLLQERFRAAGWRTAAVVGSGVLRSEMGWSRGFDCFDDGAVADLGRLEALHRFLDKNTWAGWLLSQGTLRSLYPRWLVRMGRILDHGGAGTARCRDGALRILDGFYREERPWFLFLHFLDPHSDYAPAPALLGRDGPRHLPPAYGGGEVVTTGLLYGLEEDLAAGRPEAEAALAVARARYREEIRGVDAALGRILARIEASGRPAVVLVTSDHGEHFGEHDRLLHANTLYEPLVRVPFLLAGPGVPTGRLPVVPGLEDVAPTLLAAAGLPAPGPGRNLLDPEAPSRPHVEHFRGHMAVRDGPWKLHLDGVEPGLPAALVPRALYRLDRDPGEEQDLLAAEPEVAGRLLDLARAAVAGAGRKAPEDVGAGQEALLEALGYAGD